MSASWVLSKDGDKASGRTGVKNLIKHYGAAGIDYLKTIALEAAQEAVMEPWSQMAKRITYKKNMPLFGEDSIFDVNMMAEAGYGGIAMSIVLGALGLPFAARSHISARRAMKEGKIQMLELAAEMGREISIYNEMLGWERGQWVEVEQPDGGTSKHAFEIFGVSGEQGYVYLQNKAGDLTAIKIGDIKNIENKKITLHDDATTAIHKSLGQMYDLSVEEGIRAGHC